MLQLLPSILVGVLLTLITVAIHASGTTWWIRHLMRLNESLAAERQFLRPMRVLCSTAVLLLLLHIVEVTVWAIAYLWLPDIEELNTVEQAVYFSTVSFTSLGYGDLVISNSWRLLSAIQAMAGLLIFGWSTALLFAVVQRLWTTSKSAFNRDGAENDN